MPETASLTTTEVQTTRLAATLTLPEDWWTLELDPRSRHQAIARCARERLADVPESLEKTQLVGQVTSRLRRLARDAEEGGALLCAALVEADEDDIVGATLLVTEAVPESAGDLLPSLLHDLVDISAEGGLPLHLSAVDLPLHGAAVRAVGLAEHALPDGTTAMLSYVHHVVLPVEAAGLALVLTFSTVSVHLRESLAELFDAIAGACLVEAAAELAPTDQEASNSSGT